eukprot:2905257-Lingulodinium_polyedra.AAC.1
MAHPPLKEPAQSPRARRKSGRTPRAPARRSSTCITMVDLKISIQGSTFVTAPIWKQTSLGIPLCESSAHPAPVHASWPIASTTRLQSVHQTFRLHLKQSSC